MSRRREGGAGRALARLALVGLCLGAAPAGAVEPADGDLSALRACLDEAGDGDEERACVEIVADACAQEPDGETTIGMAACYEREGAAWDAILDERLAKARADAETSDADLAETGDEYESVADALATSQEAWLAFRDAECARQWADVQGGTIRLIVYPACVRDLTAERAINLRPSNR